MDTRSNVLSIGIASYFLLVLCIYLHNLYPLALNCDGWTIGDWLINYSAGFVRRGVSGTTILLISDTFSFRPNLTVFYGQSLLYIFYISILFILIRGKRINIWFIILLLSPATLLFQVYDEVGMGRKEIILYFLFGLFIICLNKNSLNLNKIIILFTVLLSIAVLSHELIFFYLPYFIFALYLKLKAENGMYEIQKGIYLIVGPLLVLLAIVMVGKEINGPAICSDLLKRGLNEKICKGVLVRSFDVMKIAKDDEYFSGYSKAFLLGLIPFLFFVQTSVKAVSLKRFLVIFIGLLIFSLPLFIFAIDWGRWISIHFMMLVFLFTSLLENKSSAVRSLWSENKIIIPGIFRTKNNLLKLFGKIIFLSLATLYLISWIIGHCYEPFKFVKLNYHYLGILDLLHYM